ncbi:MAG: arsenic efflux protein [Bacteroidaceae bacterium]|nr:arsenic efflux protein [Bacteroidaceae bacterium]
MIRILTESLATAILVTGLVVIMMMLIEVFNVRSDGRMFRGLHEHRVGQVLLSALLGAIPGCMGGFASVSLYTHGLISFGALIAMMIASSGDEAFVMLAMFPGKSALIFLILFVVAVVTGLMADLFHGRYEGCRSMNVHDEDREPVHEHSHTRHFGRKRLLMLFCVMMFLCVLLKGWLDVGDSEVTGLETEVTGGFGLLSEEWMYWLFAALSMCVTGVLLFGSDHFVEVHLWEHIVVRHLIAIFIWTFGTVLLLGLLMSQFDIASWISDNTLPMILLAAAVGVIPESGPHLIFVSLYAAGVVPLPVLMANCISQDGHASLPLLAESRGSFLKAKLINAGVGVGIGLLMTLVC